MNDLEVIKEAYAKVGIDHVIRTNGVWSYLLLCNKTTAKEFETADLDSLLRQHSFMEFKDGKIASY